MAKFQRSAAVAALCAAIMLVPMAALAFEGGFDTSLSGVGNGFSSRNWADSDLDAASTQIRFNECTNELTAPGTPTSAGVQLSQVRAFLPDINAGQATFDCTVSGLGVYGRVPAGEYRFTIISIDGTGTSGSLSAPSVGVAY